MEHVYFLERGNVKRGPIKLSEFENIGLNEDDLIWRSDGADWKNPREFEELKKYLIPTPPLSPNEEKVIRLKSNFYAQTLPISLFLYVFTVFFLTLIAYSIANNKWEEQKAKYLLNKEEVGKEKKEVGKEKIIIQEQALAEDKNELQKLRSKLNKAIITKNSSDLVALLRRIDRLSMDSAIQAISIKRTKEEIMTSGSSPRIEPIYNIPDNIVLNEDAYARGQNFMLRPFYAFFDTLYLTIDEQQKSSRLLFNLFKSSMTILLFPLIAYLVFKSFKIRIIE
jgi:hypothetical protein